MKGIICSMLASALGLCGWGLNAAGADEAKQVVRAEAIRADGGGEVVVIVNGAGEGDGGVVNVRVEREAEASGDGGVRVLRKVLDGPHAVFLAGDGDREPISLISRPEDAEGGWLGVQLAKVEEGDDDAPEIIVANVAKDSAAAAAGFEKDDVILEVDDAAVGGDIEALVRAVRDGGAGDRMKFTVRRGGLKKTLVATLGRRGDVKDVEWQYESDGGAMLHDELRARAKVLLKGDDGEWHFESLGDGLDLSALPKDISKMLPRFHTRSMNVVIGDDHKKHVAITIQRDGEGIRIESTDDGGISVTRTDADTGEETVNTYADEDALAAGDPEAFEIYTNAGSRFVIDLDDGDDDGGARSFTFSFDDNGPQAEWLEKVEEKLAEESDAVAEIMDQLKNIHIDADMPGLKALGERGDTFFEFLHGKARRTIRENSDGTIDVITRKGGDELVKRYADESDLQERNPDAYEKLLDLQGDDQ